MADAQTTDLVVRLREGACADNVGCSPRICACASMDDAADEIERLRSALDAALVPDNARFIADYYRGHLSYHGQINDLGPDVADRVQRNMETKRAGHP